MTKEYAIECRNLTRKFGSLVAVNSINLKVRKGELFGFLGPNGAGKTTTMKVLTTLLSPTEGEASVAGFDVKKESASVRSRIGVVPQEFALFDELTAMENLWYIGALFGMGKADISKRSEELLKIVGLYDKKDVPAGGYSGGMKQRLSVAAGLLHTPEILFMDEPTTGLDPQSRIALRELTKKLNDSGITIIYTTHDMEEADKLCPRIAIMDKGRVKADGTPAELKDRYGGGQRIEIEMESHNDRLLEELKRISGAKSVKKRDGFVELQMGAVSKGAVHRISRFLEGKRVNVLEIRTIHPSLEEVFINLTESK